MGLQLFWGTIVSTIIVMLAVWRGSLAKDGGIAAWVVGTLIYGFGGWQWAVLLGAFFVSSSLLSHYKEGVKQTIAEEKFDKTNQRDAGQVLANGGLGALVAVMHAVVPSTVWLPLFVGIMATVTADTWATELGTLSQQQPRLITTGRPVTVGTSGGVTVWGTAVSLFGGLFIGGCAWGVGLGTGWFLLMAGLGGLAGSLFDSLLGATVQRLYYSDGLQTETERTIDKLGETTRPIRGWAWMNNDMVNGIASIVGGVAALIISL